MTRFVKMIRCLCAGCVNVFLETYLRFLIVVVLCLFITRKSEEFFLHFFIVILTSLGCLPLLRRYVLSLNLLRLHVMIVYAY